MNETMLLNEFLRLIISIGFELTNKKENLYTFIEEDNKSKYEIFITRNIFGNVQFKIVSYINSYNSSSLTEELNTKSIELIRNWFKHILRDKLINEII